MLLGAILMTIIFLVELAGWITIRETFYTADSAQPFIVAILLPVLLNLIVGIEVSDEHQGDIEKAHWVSEPVLEQEFSP